MTAFSGDLYVAEHLQGEGVEGSEARTDQWTPSSSKPGSYDFVSQLSLHPILGPVPRGVAFGSAGSESEMYITQGPFGSVTGVNVFATGSCGNLGCATFQTLWEGAQVVPEETRPFGSVDYVAVDHSTGVGSSEGDWASGDVFVDDGAHGVVDVFETEAGGNEHYVTQVTGVSGPIAVSGFNGDFVAGSQVFRPEKEAPKEGKYALVCTLTPGAPLEGISALAVDDANGEIYVARGGSIFEFGPECRFLGGIALGASSLAVDPVSHRVFAGNRGVVDVFGPDVVLPDVVTEEPSNLALDTDPATGATSWGIEANGSVNPLGEGAATCSFAWGLTEAFGHEAPCPESLEGSSPIGVHASLTGLEPDTTYLYRLQAHNKNGTNQGEPSQDHRFRTPGPGLHSESASNVSSSSVTLEGTVAPHDTPAEPPEEHDLQAPTKGPTSYFFQYSTQSTSTCAAAPGACTSLPAAPVSVGSGLTDVSVSQPLYGLAPDTTYHYRLVAENEALPASRPGKLIAFYGPDRTFTTQRVGESLALPDNRAWELVSPADKHGATLLEPGRAGRAAAGGGQFTFLTLAMPTEANPPSSLQFVRVLSTRVAPGLWSSSDISLSRSQPQELNSGEPHDEYRFFSEDFSLAVAATEGTFSVPEGWHQNEHGEWEHFVEASPVPTEPTSYLRHDTTCSATPATCYEPLLDSEDVTSGEKYEAAGFAGATPDGTHLFISSPVQLTTTPAPQGGLYEWSAARPPAQRLSLVNVGPHGEELPQAIAAVAADGSRIVLSGSDLYARDLVTGEAAALDVNEAGLALGGAGSARASADASRVFFSDFSRLTADASPQGVDLYVCVLESAPLKCQPRDLTAPASGSFESADVSETLGVSSDGSRVYFLASGVLAPGATRGEPNLYVAAEREGKWTTTFIASPQPVGEATAVGEEHRVSPSGRWFAFSSHSPLTGYDNRDAKTGQPDSEVYLYDAESARLLCASCDPTGARPTGESVVPNTQYEHAGFEAGSRALFDTGRLFFNSADALVPQDANGNTDVYEYEPTGVGSCTSTSRPFNAATGGCDALISSGAPGPAVFLDASSTGSDAFFTTAERLVPRDVDNLLDVYDAHECTASSPCPASSILPPPCTTEASCIPPPSPQPSIFGPPSSATFSGPGNILPEPKPKTAAQIRAEKLSKALASCRHRYKRQRKRRGACEKQAHKAYGSAKRAKRAEKSPHANRRAGR